ncbi:MAG TPA: MBL fold metallo-hydrolase [Opitutae bacterium]|nr:MBL fold metallo-hydrolase [Opitutae bacterium]
METKFKILGSSSSGNAALLRTANSSILIDAGLSGKKLKFLLSDEGLDIEELSAVFLTHEHNDHSAGIRGLSRYLNLPIFANRDTIEAIQPKLPRRPNWKCFETGEPFEFQEFKVHPFSVPHDAYDPVGFYFEWGTGDLFDPTSSLAWVTDLGFVPTLVRERIRQASILVIEANHCPDMLEQDSKRPWSLKQRIRGRHGHLSNQSTFELLESMENTCWREIFLMHLSQDCNDVNLVRERFRQLTGQGTKFSTYVIDPATAQPIGV